jgi:hypothetical protein
MRFLAATIVRSAWAVMQRELAAEDRIMERTFCAALAEQMALALPVLSLSRSVPL